MPFMLCSVVTPHCFTVIFIDMKFILYIVTALQPLLVTTSDANQSFEEKHQRIFSYALAELERWSRMLLALWHRDGVYLDGCLKSKTIMSIELSVLV